MTKLKKVSLRLDEANYPIKCQSYFCFRARYLCNFIERRIASHVINSSHISILCIEGTPEPYTGYRMVPENASSAVVQVYFSQSEYDALAAGAEHEFFINMVQMGLRCGAPIKTAGDAIRSALDDFRKSGYLNTWNHKSKKASRTRGTLHCKMTPNEFSLHLTVARGSEIIIDETVLKTPPDEIFFKHRMAKFVVEDDRVAIYEKHGRTLYERSF